MLYFSVFHHFDVCCYGVTQQYPWDNSKPNIQDNGQGKNYDDDVNGKLCLIFVHCFDFWTYCDTFICKVDDGQNIEELSIVYN